MDAASRIELLDRPTVWDLIETHGGILFALATGAPIAANDARVSSVPTDVHVHSRRIQGGDLFAALPGLRVDGVEHAPDAVRRGARIILLPADRSVEMLRERCVAAGVPPGPTIIWLHPRAKSIAGAVADHVHGRPAQALFLAGVTGTNGKTSVAHLTAQILDRAGYTPAVLGTAGHLLRSARGPIHLSATHTTPDVTETVRLLARHRAHGGQSAVMEVSSHALEQGRVAGLPLRVGAFTNLTREHLDYHGTMEDYAEAKAKLWDCIEPGGTAVVFGHDTHALSMREAARGRDLRVVTVDIEHDADLVARYLSFDERGARFVLQGRDLAPRAVRLPLTGVHNVQNALVACAIARAFGAPSIPIVEAFADAVAPPGRLEPIPIPAVLYGEGFDVFVDYAHSPDALECVLGALRTDLDRRGSGRLICVFGCGGDRDRGKRAPMGRAVGSVADVAVVTSDNPRSEDPEEIVAEILKGVEGTRGRRLVEVDRRRAIERAIGMARRSDIVLIAGKGHENTQSIGDLAIPFDDRVVASETLAALAADCTRDPAGLIEPKSAVLVGAGADAAGGSSL